MIQFVALAVTLAIEIPIVLAVIARRTPSAPPRDVIAVAAMAASLITHPFAWDLNVMLADQIDMVWRLAGIELGVIAVESVVFRVALGIRWNTAIIVSTIANLASFGCGLVLWWAVF